MAKAASLVIPELKGKLDGIALRVPVEDGSPTDLAVVFARDATAEEINDAYRQAAEGPLRGIIRHSTDPIVSCDIARDDASHLRLALTQANGSLAKVFGWYDNEWGYPRLVADLTKSPASSSSPVELRTVDQADVAGRRVLVRNDFNVPLEDGRSPTTCACGPPSRPCGGCWTTGPG